MEGSVMDLFPEVKNILSPDEVRRRECAKQFAAWKAKHNVWTMEAPHMEDPWLAICLPIAHEALDGYLDKEERDDPFALFAGYCRLLDEWGLEGLGDSEVIACYRLAKRLHMEWPMSPFWDAIPDHVLQEKPLDSIWTKGNEEYRTKEGGDAK